MEGCMSSKGSLSNGLVVKVLATNVGYGVDDYRA